MKKREVAKLVSAARDANQEINRALRATGTAANADELNALLEHARAAADDAVGLAEIARIAVEQYADRRAAA